MDTTDTVGEHHESHHMYSKQFVSFFCSCESFIFGQEQICGIIFRYIGQREAKASPLLRTACERERETSDKNADMDCHAVPPPDFQAGGDSKRDILPLSAWKSQPNDATSSSRQLEAAGLSSSRRLVATEDLSNEKKVHLHPDTDGEKYIRKFDDLAKKFEPQNEEEEEEHELRIK